VEGGYTFLSAIPTNTVGKKKYETNAFADDCQTVHFSLLQQDSF